MSGFVLGNPTIPTVGVGGWLRLPVKLPVEGAHTESIHTTSQSLGGVSTTNRRALKRRWNLPLTIQHRAFYNDLMKAWSLSPGPWWLWDGAARGTDAPEPFTPSKPNWFVVTIDDITETHHSKRAHALVLTMREV